MNEVYVNLKDITKTLMNFIGSEGFEKVVSGLDSSPQNAFIGGIGIAGCLIMAECPKYIDKEEKVSETYQLCQCYHDDVNYLGSRGVCWGTKEKDPCSCKGNKTKCDYYLNREGIAP